jgi:hypothetical protein
METKQKIVEWESEPLSPTMVWRGEEEVYGQTVVAQCTGDEGEVGVHVNPREDDVISVYMTPSQALLLAERIRTAAWIAEKLAAE